MITWSYSSLKTFEQCPKKYYHLRVAKDTKDEGTVHTIYGNEAHKAAEDFIKVRAELPPKFKYMEKALATIYEIPGEKHCELKLGIKQTDTGYEACEFFDPVVWWRGIIDLLIIDGEKAYLIDYKTSKSARYADMKQLDIAAAAVFTHYPQVKRIRSALIFVVSEELVRKDHVVEKKDMYFKLFDPALDRLAGAMRSGVWNAVSSPLCKFCPVKQCEHYVERK